MRKLLFVLMVGLLALLLTACGGETKSSTQPSSTEKQGTEAITQSNAPQAQEFTFGAATQGGLWYTLAGAMGDEIQKAIPGSTVTVIEGGSITNLLGLESGKFQIGFSNGQTVPEALNGIGKFEKKAENIRFVATLYPNVYHMVVRADSDIYTVEDLKGKRVSPGIKGYSGELVFQQILKLNNMSYDDLAKVEYVGTADGANLLRDGHIDAIVGMIAAPVSTFQELDTTIGIRLIPLSDETISKMRASNDGFKTYTIKAGTYNNFKEDTNTVAAYTVFLANKDLSDDTVYTLTKMIVENAEKWKTLSKIMNSFDGQFSIDNQVGPIHPGAEKYYKEAGYLK
ncbi:TAXI family TRAP transporter solute-binding subunit [Microaerobacter geothermalis]|uniref:TAXI family TRAP transporter solute-binding subunit n=1 Tax=Microaerobacter geothermalis TaxID=674972 RepID=UPI001F37FB38|nr:TAXI family TRAP transporter solute-binding subunit [Microaerobacter geothermalis]MCF6094851.1 TAXI family TRAP transporter solute-binding subunit [Microaerobacter geothermalis]